MGGRSKREEIYVYIKLSQISQVALVVKNQPAKAGDIRDAGSIPGSERPLEENVTTQSSILVWRISGTEGPGRLVLQGIFLIQG